MHDIPAPVQAFAELTLQNIVFTRGSVHQPSQPKLEVFWARNQDDVRAAQRLRYQVFATEMGAQLKTPIAHHDIDLYDDFCEHLIVRNSASEQVIGTYRLLTPTQAKRLGCYYTESEFDLTRLRAMRDDMVELGRSCVHPEHRQGNVILALWMALCSFMVSNRFGTMIGCASIPMNMRAPDGQVLGAHAAASIWHNLSQTHLASIAFQVRPRLPLPIEQLDTTLKVDPPALIRGYLRMGAKILGAPAWDPDFNTADLPMLMRVSDLQNRFKKSF